jgi:hypothetical protein
MSTDSVIIDRPVNRPIHCIYFYYLKYPAPEEQQEDPIITLYYDANDTTPIRTEGELHGLIKKLSRNAVMGDYGPPPCGDGFGQVPWRRRSYFVLMTNDLEHSFPNPAAVSIDYEHGEDENHSFFNARTAEIDLSDNNAGAMVSVFYCVNLMKHKSGRDMEDGDRERYAVNFHTRSGRELRFDDGGTNHGGPIPPLHG